MKFFRRRAAPEVQVAALETSRLQLVAMTPSLLAADEAGRDALSLALHADVTPEWPPADWEPHVLVLIAAQLQERPDTLGWHRYVLLRGERAPTLVGCLGGFPKAEGDVELGYSTLPGYQRQGYASEAALALATWLLAQPGVTSVSAQAHGSRPESLRVMDKCGMVYAGAGDEPDSLRYRRTRGDSAI